MYIYVYTYVYIYIFIYLFITNVRSIILMSTIRATVDRRAFRNEAALALRGP